MVGNGSGAESGISSPTEYSASRGCMQLDQVSSVGGQCLSIDRLSVEIKIKVIKTIKKRHGWCCRIADIELKIDAGLCWF